MHFEKINYSAKALVGLHIRTGFNDSKNSKIQFLVQEYFSDKIATKIPFRKNPGVTYAVYTDYSSDEYGEYLYFIGEAVEKIEKLPLGLSTVSIQAGKYLKFTTAAGKMPEVIVQAWQNIWSSTKENLLDGTRNYRTDFEVYDERANDPRNTVVDIFVGVK